MDNFPMERAELQLYVHKNSQKPELQSWFVCLKCMVYLAIFIIKF